MLDVTHRVAILDVRDPHSIHLLLQNRVRLFLSRGRAEQAVIHYLLCTHHHHHIQAFEDIFANLQHLCTWEGFNLETVTLCVMSAEFPAEVTIGYCMCSTDMFFLKSPSRNYYYCNILIYCYVTKSSSIYIRQVSRWTDTTIIIYYSPTGLHS